MSAHCGQSGRKQGEAACSGPLFDVQRLPAGSRVVLGGLEISYPALSRTGAATTEPSADPLCAPFFRSLYTTCSDILEYEKQTRSRGGPRKLKGNFGLGPKSNYHPPDKANSPLHLDEDADADPGESVVGASLGWTTLTANRTSVKAIVKEINARAKVEMYESFMHGTGSGDDDGVGRDTTTMDEGAFPIDVSATVAAQSAGPTSGPSSSSLTSSQNGDASHPSTHNVEAAIWLIDPRSLAEGMRADSED
ncbi:hypothetical protein D9757_014851 [Collybiopsis confluens]|uniref:Uncharacterized protein n=1 Tax=Collybiopsis confluens TaxID=2823264 RepID=A0A8H5CEX8_9AGAR|nr:hypothetical protein D9757_014851 [Collybiopsis confluens]